jgi:PAS domain-containing protein
MTSAEHQTDTTFLIADVAALTDVPPPQLRSWEQAGILHPRRSPKATRLYTLDDVARVKLIKRSLSNPGRRGSLRRIARELAAGTLVPTVEDYAGLPGAEERPALSDAEYWQAVVASMDELVVVCNGAGRMTSINPALRALLGLKAAHVFERYWRAADAAQGIRGAGLGLYVCRAILAAHGGHIWVERSAPVAETDGTADGWHGTVMALVLPRDAAQLFEARIGKLDADAQAGVAQNNATL